MTDLTNLLTRTAARTPVGPPPLAALHTGAKRRRRRRTATSMGAAAAAVGAVIGATTLLTPHPPTTAAAPPPTRLVGLGHAVIAVPADWPTNKSNCGTPRQDTLLLDDPTEAQLCMFYRPAGVESVQLANGGPRADFRADRTLEIDGVPAERQQTTCAVSKRLKTSVTFCSGTVFIPSLLVWFRAESSTDAAEVDRMLDRIQILSEQSGVPSYWSLGGAPTGPVVGKYTPLLAVAGLKARYKQVKSPSYPTGTILGVSPAAGTVLPVGSTVTVTVAK
ncbi:PASTA domain-containing protein [Kribbella sp. NPDC004536]|uniref:PASTA domain-containing protein n=1 Tax=Kribbella sp. NPDC004536 TaxID=3364106 RepID=UPI0036C341EE